MMELFSAQSLITRQAARELFTHVSTLPENNITLDFSKISFASRSFFDELNNCESNFKLLGKKMSFYNLDPALASLHQVVKNTSQLKSSMSYSNTSSAQTISI